MSWSVVTLDDAMVSKGTAIELIWTRWTARYSPVDCVIVKKQFTLVAYSVIVDEDEIVFQPARLLPRRCNQTPKVQPQNHKNG